MQRQANYETVSHVDPFLKLHMGLSHMMTVTADILNGNCKWNIMLSAVILKSHMANVPLSTCCVDGYYMNNVLATDDEHLACQDANDNNTFIIKMEQARHKVPVMVNHTCMDTNCKDKQSSTSL